jgi:hypothetical protein
MEKEASEPVQPHQQRNAGGHERCAQIFVAKGGDRIEHADEVGKDVRVLGAVDGGCTAVLLSKLCGGCISILQQEPPVSKNLARVGWTELIDILDRMLGQLVDALWVAAQG